MVVHRTVERVVNLLDPTANALTGATFDEAVAAVASGDPARVRALDGHFAIAARVGHIVRMARSLGRPLRYFLAKQVDGPCLILAERIDAIRDQLDRDGLLDQFHPSYTRMVPAHHLVEIALVGCPDPNPAQVRFFSPARDQWPADPDAIGAAYVGALARECDRWLDSIDDREPIGVLFSGGIDSGCVLLVLHHLLLARGAAPTRLKAFTLSVDGGEDAEQAAAFLDAVDLSYLLEVVETDAASIRIEDAVRTIEDYKPLDVQAAAMAGALCRGIRVRYADWKYLVDGDGGDENLKDYPIEENAELTIRSVLNNRMLYHEGWGIDAIKHSVVYSGGLSRGHVRSYAPARLEGFHGFSPFALPNVIEVAEGIPFVALTDWDTRRLYALKGEIVRRGVERVTGLTMPIHVKRRFQHGAFGPDGWRRVFPTRDGAYRRAFEDLFAR